MFKFNAARDCNGVVEGQLDGAVGKSDRAVDPAANHARVGKLKGWRADGECRLTDPGSKFERLTNSLRATSTKNSVNISNITITLRTSLARP